MNFRYTILFCFISFTSLQGQSIDGVYSGEFVDKKCVLTLSSLKSSVIGKIWSQYGKSSFLGTYDGALLAGKFDMSGVPINFRGQYKNDSLYFSYLVPAGKDSAVEYMSLFTKVSNNKSSIAKVDSKSAPIFLPDKPIIGRWRLVKSIDKSGVVLPPKRLEKEYLENGKEIVSTDELDKIAARTYPTEFQMKMTYTYQIKGSKLISTMAITTTVKANSLTYNQAKIYDYEVSRDSLKTVSDTGIRSSYVRIP